MQYDRNTKYKIKTENLKCLKSESDSANIFRNKRPWVVGICNFMDKIPVENWDYNC